MPGCWIFQIIKLPILIYVLTCCFCYCSFTWAAQLIRGVLSLDISFICWFRVILFVFCSLHCWINWWSRRQGAMWYQNGWCIDILRGLFEFFLILVKANHLFSFKCWIIRISRLSGARLKEFFCIWNLEIDLRVLNFAYGDTEVELAE